jgi:hypothetical protein
MEVAMKRRVLTIDQHRAAAELLNQAQDALWQVLNLVADSDVSAKVMDRILAMHDRIDLAKVWLDDTLIKAHGRKAPDLYWSGGNKQVDVLVVGEQPAKNRTPITGVGFDN